MALKTRYLTLLKRLQGKKAKLSNGSNRLVGFLASKPYRIIRLLKRLFTKPLTWYKLDKELLTHLTQQACCLALPAGYSQGEVHLKSLE